MFEISQQFPGYKVLEKTYQGEHSSIYRAYDASRRPVFIKQFWKEASTLEHLARFRREYRITSQMHSDRVIKVLEWIEHEQNPALVLEDFGGRSLSDLYKYREMDIETFFDVSIAITKALSEIHKQ